MKEIKLKDKTFVLYVEAKEIREAISRIAQEIKADIVDKDPLFVCIMNGAFMFAAELMKELNAGYEVAFARYSSYQGIASTFELKEIMPVTQPLEGRTVIILEDLIDTGFTMMKVKDRFLELGAKDVYIATLLLKPDALRCEISADYVGLEIKNDFIVGHGLDYDGLGRMYDNIYRIKA